MAARFQRARKPEEKEVRRRAILGAARKLVDRVGTSELSLNELARQSGVSKPNVYRYFESREEVLLQLWIVEVRELEAHLDLRMPKVAMGDTAGVARLVASSFAERPRLCELFSIVASVLERNLSADAILVAKMTLAELATRISGRLNERLPKLSFDDCFWFASAVALVVSGLWPAVNHGPVVAQVLSRPELKPFRREFEPDLRRHLEVLLAGLTRKE